MVIIMIILWPVYIVVIGLYLLVIVLLYILPTETWKAGKKIVQNLRP